ncbi:hypothetical protein ACGFX7_23775 [Streptomyces harbinensis]|uniref:hypothetical protein n=1 Tax=Streptomyces harbinensis TaxID=1176198 RepID=UPI00371A1854
MPHWPGAGADSLFSTVNPFPQGANVTYASVRNADLGPLDSTVTSLATLTAKLGEMEQDAAAMNGMAHGSLWTGLNATVSKAYIHRTAGKFTDAHTQAEALHSILRTLLTDLRNSQNALRQMEQNADSRGLHISADGTISSSEPPHLTYQQAAVGSILPGREQVPAETLQAMQDVSRWINEIIDEAEASDRVAARALTDILAEGNGRFVTTDLTSMEDARESQVAQDAEAVVALARKEEKTAADWRMLGDYFTLHADDPEFAGYVVDTVGIDSYLALAQELDHTEGVDSAPIRTGMANTLNTAMSPSIDIITHPPGSDAYTAWLSTEEGRSYERRLNALHTIGPERLSTPESWIDPVRDERKGYDFFLDLMESADGPMHDVFYYDMLDGMVAAEKTNAGIWVGERYPDTDTGWDPKNNGTDRLLALGARDNVEATTRFFDPDETDNLDYFIGDGKDSRTVFFGSDMVRDLFSDRTYNEAPGLADALETAVTGRALGGLAHADYEGHSEQNIRIAEHIWGSFADNPGRARGDGTMPDLRPMLGTLAADYMPDITYAANRSGSPHAADEAVFSRAHTDHLLWEIGTSPKGYEKVVAANQAQLYVAIDQAVASYASGNEESMRTAIANAATRSGIVAGIMTDATTTARHQEQLAADAAHNADVDQWNFTVDLLLGGAIYGGLGAAPGEAAMAASAQQMITESIFDKFRVDNSAQAQEQAIRQYGTSGAAYIDSVTAAVDAALDRHAVDPQGIDHGLLLESYEASADSGFDRGAKRIER